MSISELLLLIALLAALYYIIVEDPSDIGYIPRFAFRVQSVHKFAGTSLGNN